MWYWCYWCHWCFGIAPMQSVLPVLLRLMHGNPPPAWSKIHSWFCAGGEVWVNSSTTLRYQLQQPVHALHFLCSCLNSGHFGIIRTLWEQPHKTQPSNNWVALSSLVCCLSLSSRIHNISTLSITSTLCSFTPYKLYIFSTDMILAVPHHHHIQKARKIQHICYIFVSAWSSYWIESEFRRVVQYSLVLSYIPQKKNWFIWIVMGGCPPRKAHSYTGI